MRVKLQAGERHQTIMKTPVNTCLIALLLALVASACSSDASVEELSAVAQSNATAPTVNEQFCNGVAKLGELRDAPGQDDEDDQVAALAVLGQVATVYDDVLESLPTDIPDDVRRYLQTGNALAIGLEHAVSTGQEWNAFAHVVVASQAAKDVGTVAVLNYLETTCPELQDSNQWIVAFEPHPEQKLTAAETAEIQSAIDDWLADPVGAAGLLSPEVTADFFAEASDNVSSEPSKAEHDAVMAIFDDLAAKFPTARRGEDIAEGGRCPFGDQYGALLVERELILCFIEATYEVYGISPNPFSVQFESSIGSSGVQLHSNEAGTVEWSESTLDGERFLFVERFVDDLTVFSTQAVSAETDGESLATVLHQELEQSFGDRVRALAMFDLPQLLAGTRDLSAGVATGAVSERTREAVTDTDTDTADSVTDLGADGSSSTSRAQPFESQTISFESVQITVSAITWNRHHLGGTGRDTDDVFFNVQVSFDRSHNLDSSNFSIVSPAGVVASARDDGELALDRATLRFPVSFDIESASGWQFKVERGTDSVTVEL